MSYQKKSREEKTLRAIGAALLLDDDDVALRRIRAAHLSWKTGDPRERESIYEWLSWNHDGNPDGSCDGCNAASQEECICINWVAALGGGA